MQNKPPKIKTCNCGYQGRFFGKKCSWCRDVASKVKRLAKFKKQGFKNKKYKPTGEKALFDIIAQNRPLISFLSGKDLTQFIETKFYVNLFAHLLNKGQYKFYRLNPVNIILLTPYEHHLLDHGTAEQREKYAKENNCDWNKIYHLRDALKEQYNKEHPLIQYNGRE